MQTQMQIPSTRQIRHNIWSALLSASDQEIHDGMHFYHGAHGLCRFLGKVHNVSVECVAGIYAALSPMNGWETNVANMIDVLRVRGAALYPPKVNTTSPNLYKALEILNGKDPLSCLKGRKVTAFYRSIANPDDNTHIPIDRHLICLALGLNPTKNHLSRLASNRELFAKLHTIYLDMGKREGNIGNRLASIAWFVQRRLEKSGQVPIPHHDSPVCCGRAMHRHGQIRYRCSVCYKSRFVKSLAIRRPHTVLVDPLFDPIIKSRPLTLDDRNRIRIQLGKSNPFANSGGYQWLSRFVVQYLTGERLRKDEHVHHENGLLHDCRSTNLSVWLQETHGRHHANKQLLYMLRDYKGRFISSSVPTYDKQLIDSEVPF